MSKNKSFSVIVNNKYYKFAFLLYDFLIKFKELNFLKKRCCQLMVNYYIAAPKLLPTKEYESKQNYDLAIDDINDFDCWFGELQ